MGTTMTVTTKIDWRYLQNKSKQDLCSLMLLILDMLEDERKVTRKIPVTERLPRECRDVLVFEYNQIEEEYYPGIGFIGIDHQWHVSSFAGRFEPTHWMDMELR